MKEQLINANHQIKSLQEYIKKRGFESTTNKELEEKNQIIKRLKNFIMNNNESILVGSLGSSMISKEESKRVSSGDRSNGSSNDGQQDIMKAIM
jgi:hypothetical protein